MRVLCNYRAAQKLVCARQFGKWAKNDDDEYHDDDNENHDGEDNEYHDDEDNEYHDR